MIRAKGARLSAIAIAVILGAANPAAWARPAAPANPWGQWFPGLQSMAGLSEPEQKLARQLEKNPKLIQGPETKALLEEWQEEQKIARVTATLPWKTGPVELPLGGVARLALPPGFQFVDPQGVAAFYRALGQAVPASASFETRLGKVMATGQGCLGELVLLQLGHTDDRQPLPADDILEELNGHRGGAAEALERFQHPQAPRPMPVDIRWLQAPVVDVQRHTLTWARNGDPSLGEIDRFSFVLFGKDSCLLMEFPDPPEGQDLSGFQARLKPLLDGLAFLPGHAYSESHGPEGKLTMRVLVRGSMTALERESEALVALPKGVSMGESFWAFLVSQGFRIASALCFVSLAYASWRRRRKT